MFRSPTHAGLPPLRFLVSDIPASQAQIATHLGIAPRTLAGYLRADQAPRLVMLALFWETRWGRSAADCEAANYGAMQAGRAHALERENAALKRQVEMLEGLMAASGSASANSPFFYLGVAQRRFHGREASV